MLESHFLLNEESMWAALTCLALMGVDVVTGFIGAWVNHNLSSAKMREGIGHKALLVLLLVAAWLVNYQFPIYLPAAAYVVVMEVVSITENVCEAYPSLKGSKLAELFNSLGKDERKEDGTNGKPEQDSDR